VGPPEDQREVRTALDGRASGLRPLPGRPALQGLALLGRLAPPRDVRTLMASLA